jgi:hypothetical protein
MPKAICMASAVEASFRSAGAATRKINRFAMGRIRGAALNRSALRANWRRRNRNCKAPDFSAAENAVEKLAESPLSALAFRPGRKTE